MVKGEVPEHIDSWKESINPFEIQLKGNLKELQSQYPEHWNNYISIVKKIPHVNRVIDIGCGAGVYFPLSEKMKIDYIGYDYSPAAIEVAKSQWGGGRFECLDYKDLTKEHILDTDLVVSNAMFDVLPDADDALEFILSLQPKQLLAQRIRVTNEDSHFTEHHAYGIITYMFFHNNETIINLGEKYNYKLTVFNLTSGIDVLFQKENL
jgi:trans-aconitate methyltransferase